MDIAKSYYQDFKFHLRLKRRAIKKAKIQHGSAKVFNNFEMTSFFKLEPRLHFNEKIYINMIDNEKNSNNEETKKEINTHNNQ